MLLKPEPLFLAVESILVGQASGLSARTVLLSAQGRLFNQKVANDLASLNELLLICGRYEGVDERVAEHLADDELLDRKLRTKRRRIGSSSSDRCGRTPVTRSIRQRIVSRVRVVPGYRTRRRSARLSRYTRPADFRGWKVPEVLLSGNHEESAAGASARRGKKPPACGQTSSHRPRTKPKAISARHGEYDRFRQSHRRRDTPPERKPR